MIYVLLFCLAIGIGYAILILKDVRNNTEIILFSIRKAEMPKQTGEPTRIVPPTAAQIVPPTGGQLERPIDRIVATISRPSSEEDFLQSRKRGPMPPEVKKKISEKLRANKAARLAGQQARKQPPASS